MFYEKFHFGAEVQAGFGGGPTATWTSQLSCQLWTGSFPGLIRQGEIGASGRENRSSC